MKALVLIALVAAAIWLWRSSPSPAVDEAVKQQAQGAQPSPAASVIGRWRDGNGQNFAFRDNGSFTMNRRLKEASPGMTVNFNAGMRGKWRAEGGSIVLTIDKVESVSIQSVTPDASAYPTASAADTAANALRVQYPQLFTQAAEGTDRRMSLEWQGTNRIVFREDGTAMILTRVE